MSRARVMFAASTLIFVTSCGANPTAPDPTRAAAPNDATKTNNDISWHDCKGERDGSTILLTCGDIVFTRVQTVWENGHDEAFRSTFSQMLLDFIQAEDSVTIKNSRPIEDDSSDSQSHTMEFVDSDGRSYLWQGTTHIRIEGQSLIGVSCIDTTGAPDRCGAAAPQLFDALPEIDYVDTTEPLHLMGRQVVAPPGCRADSDSISCENNVELVWSHRDPESPNTHLTFADILVDGVRGFIRGAGGEILSEDVGSFACIIEETEATCRRRAIVTNGGTVHVVDVVAEVNNHGVALVCTWASTQPGSDVSMPSPCLHFVRPAGSVEVDVH